MSLAQPHSWEQTRSGLTTTSGPIGRSAVDPWYIEGRNLVLLIVVALYIVFNYGFMLIRVPPIASGGVPIGEIVLIACLLTINYIKLLPRLALAIPLLPLLAWWAYGLARLLIDFLAEGIWALRDGIHVIESLFLIVGFAFAGSEKYRRLFFRAFIFTCVVAALYALLLPLKDELNSLPPQIVNAQGIVKGMFGYFGGHYVIMTTLAVYLYLFSDGRRHWILLALLLVLYAFLIYQVRMLYFVIIAIFCFLMLQGKLNAIRPVVTFVGLLVIIVGAITLSGLEIEGQKNQPISFRFIYDLFAASFGATDSASGASISGAALRFGWWRDVLQRLGSDPRHLLFGVGYGVPLTDTDHGQYVIREPHNSYVSIIARLGVVGFVLWCWLHLGLLSAWRSARDWGRANQLGRLPDYMLVIMAYFVGVWVTALGQDVLEKPYVVIPYYFSWGVILRFAYGARRATFAGTTMRRAEDAVRDGRSVDKG